MRGGAGQSRRVRLVAYSAGWPKKYEKEAKAVAEVFGEEILETHHIGSTAIPGILAKPIIDLLVVVRDIERIDAFDDLMISKGYVPKGEFGIAGRRFFIKGTEINRSHHIHMFQKGNPEIVRHIDFRDYLIAHPEEAEAYARLKRELARKFPRDVESYTKGKDKLVGEMNRKARKWRMEGRLNIP